MSDYSKFHLVTNVLCRVEQSEHDIIILSVHFPADLILTIYNPSYKQEESFNTS